MIGPGVSTQEIDRLVYETTTRMGGIPAPLNYEGYPKTGGTQKYSHKGY